MPAKSVSLGSHMTEVANECERVTQRVVCMHISPLHTHQDALTWRPVRPLPAAIGRALAVPAWNAGRLTSTFWARACRRLQGVRVALHTQLRLTPL